MRNLIFAFLFACGAPSLEQSASAIPDADLSYLWGDAMTEIGNIYCQALHECDVQDFSCFNDFYSESCEEDETCEIGIPLEAERDVEICITAIEASSCDALLEIPAQCDAVWRYAP